MRIGKQYNQREVDDYLGWQYSDVSLTLRRVSGKERPDPIYLLRALPGFLQEAIDALDAIDKLSIRQFQLITNKLLELGTKLDEFEKLVPGKSLELDTISNEEILKEQLSDIKKTL